jgi:c-di-GMP-related signal transduction protein
VAIRSRTLELLAKAKGLDKNSQEQAFMAGMFSLLAVLFGMTLEEVIAPLPLGEALQGALLRGEGDIGALLQLIGQAEAGDLAACAASLASLHLGAAEFNEAAISAHGFMLDAVRESKGKHG